MIEIRKAEAKDAEGIIDVNFKTWRTTYSGIVNEDFLQERDANRQERVDRLTDTLKKIEVEGGKAYRYVALDNGKVVGFVTYGSYRDEAPELECPGEIYAIYVLQEYQGQGIGKRLIHHAVIDLKDEDYRSVVIWALKDNPNATFYKKIGGEARCFKSVSFGSQVLEEVGFLYADIKILAENTKTAEK